jgi:prepilin-type N-terminal cleavage/methylation domain-containing protein
MAVSLRWVRPAPDRAGFTLIELVVALVVSGLLATVIFQVILGQSRFARFVSAREEVQQNARAALELISSELRAVGEFGILNAAGGSITFMSPTTWGVVCGEDAGLVVAFPSGSVPDIPDGNVDLSVRRRVNNAWSIVFVSGQAQRAVGVPASCTTLGADPAIVASQVIQFTGAENGASAGDQAHVHEQVTYTTGAAAGVPGTWLLRNGAPVAGPLANGGFQLQYINAAGATFTPTGMEDIKAVNIVVNMSSRARLNGRPQDSSGAMMVHLRNRLNL